MSKPPEQKVISKKHQIRIDRERKQRKVILVGAIILAILVVGVITYGILDQFVFKQNQAVATVNSKNISVKEFQTRVRYSRWQLIQQYYQTLQTSQMFQGDQNFDDYFKNSLNQIMSRLDDPEAIGQSTIDQLVEETVIQQEAQKRGIVVSDSDVEEKLQSAFGYYAHGTPTPVNTPTMIVTSTFSPTQLALITLTPTPTIAPSDTNTPEPTKSVDADSSPTPMTTPSASPTAYTLEGFQKSLKQYIDAQPKNTDISEADLRQIIRIELLREKLTEALTSDIKTEEEQVWARHILVKDESAANAVLERIKNKKEDWAKVASEVSLDTSNKDSGGDLGWFGKGKMVAEFESTAFNLKIGEISQPVQTQFGYHIIQVLGHEVRPLSESEISSVRQQKFSEWLTQATTGDAIKKFDLWKQVIPTEPTLASYSQ